MKQSIKKYFPLAILLIAVSACLKTDMQSQLQNFVGGKGGVAIIKATPIHNVAPVDSCMIYIKYNTLEAPVNNKYDDSAVCIIEIDKPVASFSELKRGDYFLYGKSFDPISKKIITGGFAWQITDSNKINNVTVPLSE